MRPSAHLKQNYQIISLLNEAKCWHIKYPVVTVFMQRPGIITYVRNYMTMTMIHLHLTHSKMNVNGKPVNNKRNKIKYMKK